MKKMQRLFAIFALVLGIGTVLAPALPAYASIDVFTNGCASESSSAVCQDSKTANGTSMIKTVINTILYILGIVAVIMIIIGGIRYSVSAGDASNVKGAKNTILYAVIGLVVAISAYSIVNFVITAFK